MYTYNNYDPYSDTPGDDADGFDVGFITARSGNDRVNTMIGCRAWSNSDDGFDLYQYPGYHGIYIMDHCWAWKNGYTSDGVTMAGDGNGFKLGADNNSSHGGALFLLLALRRCDFAKPAIESGERSAGAPCFMLRTKR